MQDELENIDVLYKNSSYFKIINNAISDHLAEADEIEIVNETKIWCGSNYKTFLDSVISKYHGESTVIKELCVPIKGDQWSILDVKVISDKTVHKNGYVQKSLFSPSIDSSPNNLETITNKIKLSPVSWTKYFGLYTC